MIAYIDTCTVLNLLQINYDDEYIRYLEKAFDQIKLTPKVFEELNINKFENVIDDANKDVINNILFHRLQPFIDYDKDDDALAFTKKYNSHCFKENGESHSIGYAIKQSRFGESDLGENLLKTHFISDDAPAKTDFDDFYYINVLGQIINSIDLMTIFWLKQYISKSSVVKYCHTLKQLYCKEVSVLLIKLRDHSSQYADNLNGKQKILITKLIDILSNLRQDTPERVNEILSDREFKLVLRKNKDWQSLFDKVVSSNFREKIPYIEKRIQDLDKVWS